MLVHLHGALFVGWIVLLVVQTGLVTSGNVALHRKLGVAGALLAPLMVMVAILTLISSVQRHSVPDLPPAVLLAGDLLQLLFFCIFVAWGVRSRRVAAQHKRLMLFATICVLAPALSRWPFDFIQPVGVFFAVYCAFPLSVLAYDLLSVRRIDRVTVWGCALFAVMLAGMFLIPAWPAWQRFTDFVAASPRIIS